MGPQELWRRLSTVIRYRPVDAEFAEEIEAHLDLAARDYEAQGMSAQEARRAARIDLGGVEQAKELHRQHRGLPILEQLGHDLRLAVRSLRRDAQLTFFSVSIVALGIAAAALVFSVTSALLLRPLPFEDPERLVWVANGESENLSAQTLQVDNLLDLRSGSQTFDSMAGFYAFYGPGDIHLDDARGPQRITGVPITEGLLPLLGVEPILGRAFTKKEVAGREPVALLGHDLWRARYDGDPEIVGRALSLDGEPTTVIGVLPESFDFERIFTPGRGADLFLPFPLDARNNRRGNTLAVIGRLAPDVAVGAAQEDVGALAAAIGARDIERRNSVRPRLIPLHERVAGDTRTSLWMLGGAVALLMSIVCANLSNLLLARATGRRREMALHTALGAKRGRLVRKLLLESLMLSGLGTVLGVGLAYFGAGALSKLDGTGIPLLHQVQIDGGVLLFAAGLATFVGLLFGVVPALQASVASPSEAMRGFARASGNVGSTRMRRFLVVSEIALACMLLVGVGLLLRSLFAALSTDPGFDTENVVALRVDLPYGTLEADARLARLDLLLDAVRGLPEVESAGLTDALPLGDNFGWRTWDARAAGWTENQDSVSPLVRLVDEGYWKTLGLRVLAGRSLLDTDQVRFTADGELAETQDRVVVVNEALAARLWPDAASPSDVLSRRLVSSGREYRVVGVVEEARYFSLEQDSGPEMYFSFRQLLGANSLDLVMRTRVPSADALPAIRSALAAAAPSLSLAEIQTMDGLVDQSTFRRRAVLGVLSGFGGFGLLLALLGVYSVIAYTVAQNRRALGIRMAFGATGRRLSRELLAHMLKPITLGSGIGLAAGFQLARVVSSQLYGVSPNDPATYAAVAVILVSGGLVAAYLPARRAAQMEVTEVLRDH